MKIKEYTVVNAGHLRTLEAIINLMLVDGWIPAGGIYSVPKTPTKEYVMQIGGDGGLVVAGKMMDTDTNWCQAMILPCEDA